MSTETGIDFRPTCAISISKWNRFQISCYSMDDANEQFYEVIFMWLWFYYCAETQDVWIHNTKVSKYYFTPINISIFKRSVFIQTHTHSLTHITIQKCLHNNTTYANLCSNLVPVLEHKFQEWLAVTGALLLCVVVLWEKFYFRLKDAKILFKRAQYVVAFIFGFKCTHVYD